MKLEFPAISQSRIDLWGEPQYTRKGMLLFTVLFGLFGLHHLMLRSPQTWIMFFVANIFSFGYYYIYDILQLATMTTEELNKYGLSFPWGAAGIAQGMWKCPNFQESENSPPSPIWFFLYSLLLPLGPISSLIAGDTGGAAAKLLGFIFIIILFPFVFMSIGLDYFKLLIKPKELFERGASRAFPFTWLGWQEDGMSPNLTGKYLPTDCDNIFIRFFKGSLTVVSRLLPFGIGSVIEQAVSTGQTVVETGKKVVETGKKVVDTGTKVASTVGTLVEEVPQVASSKLSQLSSLAKNPTALLEQQKSKLKEKFETKLPIGSLSDALKKSVDPGSALDKKAQAFVKEQKAMTPPLEPRTPPESKPLEQPKTGSMVGGGLEGFFDELSTADKLIGGGLAGILVGGFLMMLGRSYNETVFHFSGPSDSPPGKS